MKTESSKTIRLVDYKKPSYANTHTELVIRIFDDYTQVESTLNFRKADAVNGWPALVLNGIEQEIETISLDDRVLSKDEYQYDGSVLNLQPSSDQFIFKSITKIYPNKNTSLEGLYKSGTMICTQCEAEGFRKITFYLDRPDVMAIFTTRIEANKQQYPILLSNGNPTEQGEIDEERHFATWHDPFPKPAYLFAAVAGDLVRRDDVFVTQTGRSVSLRIFAEAHNAHKTEFALTSLKRSMRWDEQRYGREYDLDIFMIVASDYFNMGAMENKGLNIFNSAAVLASPDTSNDARFERIEAIVAHEYFHNWSGNRVTCRDWFQLTLKEGFTVYRDAQFTADMHSATVKRIGDVDVLKSSQFVEDAGPNAHPIQPQEYIEINNFYTTTVYEKGAEIIGMIHTIVGDENFRKGSDLYFETYDGQAVTTDDFIACMEQASSIDLTQFKRWYVQAGTPEVTVSEHYNADAKTYQLNFEQHCSATPGQAEKLDFVIPIKMALLSNTGEEFEINCDGNFNAHTSVLLLTDKVSTVTFKNLLSKPVASLFRDFSAPVHVHMGMSDEDRMILATKDTNEFNRFNAMQMVYINELTKLVQNPSVDISPSLDKLILATLEDYQLPNAVKAYMLSLPSYAVLKSSFTPIDALALTAARDKLQGYIANGFISEFRALTQKLASAEDYEFNAQEAGRRSLQRVALDYWVKSGDTDAVSYAESLYRAANNQSDRLNGLGAVLKSDDVERAEKLLTHFYQHWKDDTQMVETWLSLNASMGSFNHERAKALMNHEAFDITNPNKVRSVLGGFAANFEAFHGGEKSSYQFMAEQIIALDKINPQIAARLTKTLESWRSFTDDRALPMKYALELIISSDSLSADVSELAENALN